MQLHIQTTNAQTQLMHIYAQPVETYRFETEIQQNRYDVTDEPKRRSDIVTTPLRYFAFAGNCAYICAVCISSYCQRHQASSEKGHTLNGKHFLLWGENCFPYRFLFRGDHLETVWTELPTLKVYRFRFIQEKLCYLFDHLRCHIYLFLTAVWFCNVIDVIPLLCPHVA